MPSFGTLKADTLTHSTAGSVDTNYVVNGSAKVWTLDETLEANATVTESSFNVSSTSDNGTGDLHINFTNAFSANDYVGQGTNAGHSADDVTSCRYGESTTSKDDLRNFDTASKDAPVNYTAFGDLA